VEDVFGKALTSYQKGEEEPVTIRREDGHESGFDLRALFSLYHQWPEWERKSFSHVEGRILDIGCGAGRHSLWLQEKGFDVVAIDISFLTVNVAKSRGVVSPFVMAAKRLAFAPASFDTALLMGNNFGLCGNVSDTEHMLRQLYQITSGKGRIIATSNDVTKTTNPEHLSYQELNTRRGRPRGQVTLRIEHKGEVGGWFDLLMVTPKEMEEMCRPLGWVVEKVYESGDGLYAAILRKRTIKPR